MLKGSSKTPATSYYKNQGLQPIITPLLIKENIQRKNDSLKELSNPNLEVRSATHGKATTKKPNNILTIICKKDPFFLDGLDKNESEKNAVENDIKHQIAKGKYFAKRELFGETESSQSEAGTDTEYSIDDIIAIPLK